MSSQSQIATAISICGRLTTSQWVKTTALLKACGIPTTSRQVTHKLLKRLVRAKVLLMAGRGSFRWKLATDNWDRSNPFNTYPRSEWLSSEDMPRGKEDAPVQTINAPVPYNVEAAKAAAEKFNTTIGLIPKLVARVNELESLIERSAKTIEVKHFDGSTIELKDDVLPAKFDKVLGLARCRRNILLVGPAGCGKTHMAKLVAKALGLDFGSMSCTAGMSEAWLLGRSVPNISKGEQQFQTTDFLTCYEKGGVFLMDELDAADPNLLLAINSAIANGYANVPNRHKKPRAERHEDFVMVGTANTFGRGATRSYAGRNQLDEATLDRFRIGIVECTYDSVVETALCPDKKLRTMLQNVRRAIEDSGLRRVLSTRFLQDAYVMVSQGGWTPRDVTNTLTEGWTTDEVAKVQSAFIVPSDEPETDAEDHDSNDNTTIDDTDDDAGKGDYVKALKASSTQVALWVDQAKVYLGESRLIAKPHPHAGLAEKGKTFNDYASWTFANQLSPVKRARVALRTLRIVGATPR